MPAESDNPARQDLPTEDEQLDAISDEPAALRLFFKIFGRAQPWLMNVVILLSIAFAVLMFACLYQFFFAASTRAQIGWAMGFLYFALTVAMMKIWMWGEMRRYRVLREIQRLQLRIAALTERIERPPSDSP